MHSAATEITIAHLSCVCTAEPLKQTLHPQQNGQTEKYQWTLELILLISAFLILAQQVTAIHVILLITLINYGLRKQ